MGKRRRKFKTVGMPDESQIKRYVNGRIINNPFTFLIPVLAVLGAGGGFVIVQLLEFWMIALAGTGISLGALSFARDWFRKDNFELELLSELNRQMQDEAKQLEASLLETFEELKYQKGSDALRRLLTQMNVTEDVLSDKFEPGSSTYEHFHGAADALFVQALNLLKDLASQVRVNSAVDRSLASAELKAKLNEGEEQEAAMLAMVDDSITGIASLNQELSRIPSGSTEELQTLIAQARDMAIATSNYRSEISLR